MIKTLTVVLGILAMAIPANADEKGKGKGKGDGKRGEPTAEQKAARDEIIKKYDKNGDGKLDEQERAAVSEEDRAKMGHGGGKGKGKGKK